MNVSERKVVKAGYLIKSPPQDKLMAQWHRRYFILWSNKLMEYYTSHEHRPEDYLKTINLSMCEDMVAPLPVTNRPHVIKLSIRAGGKLRDYYLDCGSEGEMGAWVKCLAQVCAFCPVENVSSSGVDEDQPIYNDIDDPPDLKPSQQIRSKLRPPIHSLGTPASVEVVDPMIYDEPTIESNYHMVEMMDSFEESCTDTLGYSEEWYDDVGVDDRVVYTMNKNPPPVWHPDLDSLKKPPLPPDRRAASSEPEDRRRKPLPSSPLVFPAHKKPLPPPKPRTGGPGVVISPASVVSGAGFLGIKDDPKFKRKLQEKREEIYGGEAVGRGRSMSMGEGEEFYESVLYTVSDTRSPSPYEEGIKSRETSPAPPSLPSKTATMLRESSALLHQLNLLPPSQDHPQRGVASNQKSPQISPRHRKTNSSPITTPPPLPSRELLDPSRPPLMLPSASPREETPPPVPLRQSSIPTSPPTKSAPSPSPLSPKKGNALELATARTPFSHTLAQLLVSGPKSPARKGQVSSPQGVAECFEGYEAVDPPDQVEEAYEDMEDTEGHLEETYDDVTFGPQGSAGARSPRKFVPALLPREQNRQALRDCPPVPPRDQQEHAPTPPPRDQQELAPIPPPRDQQEHAPTPPPRDQKEHAPTLPPRDQREALPSRFHGRAGDAPQLPPNKPRAPEYPDNPPHHPHSKRKASDNAPQFPPNKPRAPDNPRRTSGDSQLPPNKPKAPDYPDNPPHSKRRTSDDAPQLPPNKPRAADVGNGPLLSTNKPILGGADATKPSIKPRTSPPTPRSRKGSAEGSSQTSPDKSPRPLPAKKPPVTKKPAIGVTSRPHPAPKKPPPPTQPKPKGLGAQPHSSPSLPPSKPRPKPAVPQKPVGLPLSSS